MNVISTKKHLIFGIYCYAFKTESDVIQALQNMVSLKAGGYSMAINAEKLYRQSHDQALRQTMLNATLPVVDGAGAVMALKWLCNENAIKVNLPMLALKALDHAHGTLVIYGTTEERNKKAEKFVKENFSNISILDSMSGFIDPNIAKDLIITKQPSITFVGLGSPKQEAFIQEITGLCPHTLFIGCGGALDIMAGEVKRAPRFMIDNNLEWLYRLLKQPSRWQRQMVLPRYFFQLLKEWLRMRNPRG